MIRNPNVGIVIEIIGDLLVDNELRFQYNGMNYKVSVEKDDTHTVVSPLSDFKVISGIAVEKEIP